MKPSKPIVAIVLAAASGAVLAHPGHAGASFFSGVAHPLGGVDHVLAMLAVGLYAAMRAGLVRRALPATFVLAMLAGAGLGAAGIALPAVEAGIAASVLVLGLLIASAARLPAQAALPLVAAFALLHGHAHQAEISAGGLATYAGGFVIATLGLHALGFIAARALPDSAAGRFVHRLCGGLIAGLGVVLIGA
jgi:urease accessory protein